MGDIKTFLYSFCGKKKVTPNYEIKNSGPKHRQRFLCEVRNLNIWDWVEKGACEGRDGS